MKFYGNTKNNVTTIFNRDEFEKAVSSIEGEFEIKVTKVKDIRTVKMNNLYWLWLSQLSVHSGYSKRELHNYFKTELLCHETEINGEKILDCESTADLSIKDFSNYLLSVSMLASQNFHFVLQDPEHLVFR